MDQVARVKVVSELFGLINTYYVERDLPTEENNFFERLRVCCELLDLDVEEVKNVFELKYDWE